MMSYTEWRDDMERTYDHMPTWYWNPTEREKAYCAYLAGIYRHRRAQRYKELKKYLLMAGVGALLIGTSYVLYLFGEVALVLGALYTFGFGN